VSSRQPFHQMEAGIDPAKTSVTHNVGTKLHENGYILHTICKIAAQTHDKQEHKIIEHLLTTILVTSDIIVSQYHKCKGDPYIHTYTLQSDLHNKLTQLHDCLWKELKHPNQNVIREYILKFLIHIQKFTDKILTTSNENVDTSKTFKFPQTLNKPSFFNQVTSAISKTIDPFLIALQKNFYYPISPDTMNDDMEDDNASYSSSKIAAVPKSPSTSPKRVTVEDSLDTITDIINELDEDDPPVQTKQCQSEETALQQAIQTKPSSYSHRFSIYKRNGIPISNLKTSTQIALFQSFCKCLKTIDPQLLILPIRNDHNIHPLSTSDQIIHIDEIGITNFFKAYKRTTRTLSGDFHIGTKLTFDELKNHKNLSTWFHLNGYNITFSGCQSSDMVRIGFLSRVRGFTYRDDMHNYISNTENWKKNKFHFRLYFDIFSSGTKGRNTYVLMIDVDRPNIEVASTFFQQNFDGDKLNSPNKIPYLFFPLYRKTYLEDERNSIIRDNDYHTENDSVVGILGLNSLNTVVQMVQGINITIRHLLLAIPCQGTSNGKLFHQVERQANNEWQLCCFHTIDTTKISLRLASLETLLKRYIRNEDHNILFTDPTGSLKFSGQAAPIKKGRPKIPILEVPEATKQYTSKALSKLYTPTPKRQAIPHVIEQLIPTNDTPLPTQNSPNPTPQNPTNINTTPSTNITLQNDMSAKIQNIELDSKNQNARLTRLEDICSQLASSTQNLSTQLITMSQNVNDKLVEMADSINQLHQTPSRRNTKYQKSHHEGEEELSIQL
jgi:hypothetical protein